MKFQYISCCSLSASSAGMALNRLCFNTSHVVVYRGHSLYLCFDLFLFQYISCCSLSEGIQPNVPTSQSFQYISCCSLSWTDFTFNPIPVRFQYISCCSLSKQRNASVHLHLCFNTSHVVVYLNEMLKMKKQYPCFNTSHVVVYHTSYSKCHVSYTFQYISCCSLSMWLPWRLLLLLRFNTSHVVVYHYNELIADGTFKFQYISCCSLSKIGLVRRKWGKQVSIHLML